MNVSRGDLAYIVGSKFPENNGRVVEVLDAYGADMDGEFCWFFSCRSPIQCFGQISGDKRLCYEGIIADSMLRPISGIHLDDETSIDTNVPEALQLALGIEARVWA